MPHKEQDELVSVPSYVHHDSLNSQRCSSSHFPICSTLQHRKHSYPSRASGGERQDLYKSNRYQVVCRLAHLRLVNLYARFYVSLLLHDGVHEVYYIHERMNSQPTRLPFPGVVPIHQPLVKNYIYSRKKYLPSSPRFGIPSGNLQQTSHSDLQ